MTLPPTGATCPFGVVLGIMRSTQFIISSLRIFVLSMIIDYLSILEHLLRSRRVPGQGYLAQCWCRHLHVFDSLGRKVPRQPGHVMGPEYSTQILSCISTQSDCNWQERRMVWGAACSEVRRGLHSHQITIRERRSG